MYADRITAAMKHAMDETNRRRELQARYNEANGITPATVVKAILDLSPSSGTRDYYAVPKGKPSAGGGDAAMDLSDRIEALRQEMFAAAENLEFEKAARLRDQLKMLKGDAAMSAIAEEAPRAKAASGGRGKRPGRGGARPGRYR
jgi:excinuclease ABC subunit B